MDAFPSFCDTYPLDASTKIEQAIAFVWFHIRSTGNTEADFKSIIEYFPKVPLPKPNSTRLRNALSKAKDVHKGSTPNSYRLSRRLLISLNEQYGHIFNSESEPDIVAEAGIEATPFLSELDFQDSRRMAHLYIILYCYENSARRLIEKILSSEFGDSWWDIAAGAKLKSKVTERKGREYIERWFSARGSSPLYYVDWGDLVTLIRKYENLFLPIIGDIKFIELRFEELERLRNIIAHNGVIASEDDFQRILLSFRDWCRQIGTAT